MWCQEMPGAGGANDGAETYDAFGRGSTPICSTMIVVIASCAARWSVVSRARARVVAARRDRRPWIRGEACAGSATRSPRITRTSSPSHEHELARDDLAGRDAAIEVEALRNLPAIRCASVPHQVTRAGLLVPRQHGRDPTPRDVVDRDVDLARPIERQREACDAGRRVRAALAERQIRRAAEVDRRTRRI